VRLDQLVRLFSCFAVWSAIFACWVPFTRGELLVEQERGRLDRYIGVGGPVAGGFTFSQATRIGAINGWMSFDGPITVSLAIDSPNQVMFSKEFTGSFAPGLPAKWQGVGDLKWDLQPGTYFVTFSDGYFPIAYGGPVSTAPQGFESTKYFDDGWRDLGFPIGARVYGDALSAVPEPASYGALAGSALLSVALLRRRSTRLNAQPPVAT